MNIQVRASRKILNQPIDVMILFLATYLTMQRHVLSLLSQLSKTSQFADLKA